jgi:hypothetical protein
MKLYRRTVDGLSYWEVWSSDQTITFHWGRVGERGQTRRVEVGPNQSEEPVIGEAVAEMRAMGFAPLPSALLREVVVQFLLDEEDIGSEAENLEFLRGLKCLLDDCLGWTGNGRCTGGDMGTKELDSLNLFCQVVDPEVAVATLAAELEAFGCTGEFSIGLRLGEEMRTVYPEDCRGDNWWW